MYDKLECPKQAMNVFIGRFGESQQTKHQHYFESDCNLVANELIHNEDDIHIRGIYKDNDNTTSANLLNLHDEDLQNLIQEAQHNTRTYRVSASSSDFGEAAGP